MSLVLTGPEGVSTVSACVVVPEFLTVIVTFPPFPTVFVAGEILNSVSVSVKAPAAGAALVVVEELDELELAAGAELLVLLLLDEPQPASAAVAAATARTGTKRRIRIPPGVDDLAHRDAGRGLMLPAARYAGTSR
jgi:hypothetical protein